MKIKPFLIVLIPIIFWLFLLAVWQGISSLQNNSQESYGPSAEYIPLAVSLPKIDLTTQAGSTPVVTTSAKEFKVSVAGAVVHPGIYSLLNGSILQDLLTKAQISNTANFPLIAKSFLLARKLKDAEHVYVPYLSDTSPTAANTSQISNEEGVTPTSEEKINLNSASLEELDSLPGIGPSIAAKIIAQRPFSSIESIKDVSGIGDSIYSKLESLITI